MSSDSRRGRKPGRASRRATKRRKAGVSKAPVAGTQAQSVQGGKDVVDRLRALLAAEGIEAVPAAIKAAARGHGRTPARIAHEIQELGALVRAVADERGLTEDQLVERLVPPATLGEQADALERAAKVHTANDEELKLSRPSGFARWFRSRAAKTRVAVDLVEQVQPTGTYRPAAWFNGKIAARLRQAAQAERRTKRVRTKVIDGVKCYLVADVAQWWPEVIPKGFREKEP